MANNLIYLSRARKEFDEAIDFYEERTIGLGIRFENQIKERIKIILEHPERYPVNKRYYRQALVKGFPYLIMYRYHKIKHTITILSFFHTSRNPKNKYRK